MSDDSRPAPSRNRRVDTEQIVLEWALLAHIRDSLRMAVQWRPQDGGAERKLSTVRFVTASFDRHLRRLRVLTDHGGYLHAVTQAQPQFAREVASLRLRRDELQCLWDDMILRLEHVLPDSSLFAELCGELAVHLGDLERHGQSESELIQHAFTQEQGGRG